MSTEEKGVALIIGAGSGLSASLARLFAADGYTVALAARNTEKLTGLCEETGAVAFSCDTAVPADVDRLYGAVDALDKPLDVMVFNAGYRARGPVVDLDPADVEKALMVGAQGGFMVAQRAAERMLERGKGTILFTGASASVKGYAQSAPFAMAKFALRGLAQSMARELAPKGIHVAHFVIDGGIRSDRRPPDPARPDGWLDPDAIAGSYLQIVNQPRNAWTWEVELRPWLESF